MEWSKEKTFEFIEEYRKRELLWNPKHPQYFNKILKNDAWKELGEAINMSAEECKAKINNFQASLRREKQKITKSLGTGKGADEVYVSSWCFFKSLQFILDKNKPRETLDTIASAQGPKDIQESQNSQTEEALKRPAETNKQLSEKSATASHYVSRKKKVDSSNDKLDQAFAILTSSVAANKKTEDDVCTIFGNFVTKKMQHYTPQTQTAVQQAIMTILVDADRGYFDNNPIPFTTFLSHGHPSAQPLQYSSRVSQPLYSSGIPQQQTQQSQNFSAPPESPNQPRFQYSYQSPHESQHFMHYASNPHRQNSAEHYRNPSSFTSPIQPPLTSPNSETSIANISSPPFLQSTHTHTPALSPAYHSGSNISMEDLLE